MNREDTLRAMTDFQTKQAQAYEWKVRYAETRAWEFVYECGRRGMGCHVSVGGLDSLTLLCFLRKIGIDAPAISVSLLEDKSIQAIHRELGVVPVKPDKSKVKVLYQCGYPIISKATAAHIEALQRPTPKNTAYRHSIITRTIGDRGDGIDRHRMQIPKKWLRLFGGADPEGAALGYKAAPFRVSPACCYWMKEKPRTAGRARTDQRPFSA